MSSGVKRHTQRGRPGKVQIRDCRPSSRPSRGVYRQPRYARRSITNVDHRQESARRLCARGRNLWPALACGYGTPHGNACCPPVRCGEIADYGLWVLVWAPCVLESRLFGVRTCRGEQCVSKWLAPGATLRVECAEVGAEIPVAPAKPKGLRLQPDTPSPFLS
jgi:hypothetical protein